jgi:hypothetical protein
MALPVFMYWSVILIRAPPRTCEEITTTGTFIKEKQIVAETKIHCDLDGKTQRSDMRLVAGSRACEAGKASKAER